MPASQRLTLRCLRSSTSERDQVHAQNTTRSTYSSSFALRVHSCLALPQGKGGGKGAPKGPGMALTSPDFQDGGIIPDKFTQADPDAGFAEARMDQRARRTRESFVLIMHDPDNALNKRHRRRAALDACSTFPEPLAASAGGLPATRQLPDGTDPGQETSATSATWVPATRAINPYHHYTLELYALDAKLTLGPDATRADVMKAMDRPHCRARPYWWAVSSDRSKLGCLRAAGLSTLHMDLVDVYSLDPRADPAQHAVRNRSRHARHLLRVDRTASPSEPSSVTASPTRISGQARDVDGGQIHRDRADDRRELSLRDHLAAIRQPVRNSIGIARGEHRDAHGACGAVDAAVADQRSGFQVFHRQHGGFPGERGLAHPDGAWGRRHAPAKRIRRWRGRAAPGSPGRLAAIGDRDGAGSVNVARRRGPRRAGPQAHLRNAGSAPRFAGSRSLPDDAKCVIRPSDARGAAATARAISSGCARVPRRPMPLSIFR